MNISVIFLIWTHMAWAIHFFFFFKFIYLFIYFWLCWVFVSVQGLSPVAASGGHSSSQCAGLSLSRPLPLRSTGSRRAGSVVVAHGPSCSAACGILPDQGSNPRPLHWQADPQPLHHQGSPSNSLFKWCLVLFCFGVFENSVYHLVPFLVYLRVFFQGRTWHQHLGCFFLLQIVNIINYVKRFPNIKLVLHSWNKSCMVMVYYLLIH